MQMDRDPGSGARGSAAAKTKGKRSKLSQRRRDDDAGAGGLPSPRFGGDGAHANGDDANVNPGSAHPGSFFTAGDPLGHDFGDAMQQGSPTLLSALKGSSLRAAYGADFAGAFKDDNMSLLGDFKNAAARFSMHPPGGLDGLSAEGDLQSDALWSSFPSDVDALFPSRVDMQLAAEMYGAGGRGGAAGGSGVGGGVGGGGGSHANNRAGSPESAADVFRQGNQPGNAPPQFIFDGYGGAPTGTGAGGGGAGNGAHPSMSLDSSYDTYAGAQFKQSARAGGDHAGMREMRAHASMAPGQPGGNGNPHADQRGEPARYFVGGGALGGSQQTQQAHMNYVQIGAYGGGPGGPGNGGNDMSNPGTLNRGGAQMGGMMMQQQQRRREGNAYQNSGNGGGAYSQPMMRVPSSGSLGMMPPGTPGYGYGGEQGQARGGFEASGKGSKRAAGKNAGGKGSGAKRGKEGKGAEMMDGGPGGAGTWSYGAPPPQMQHRVQQGGMVYHQRNPSSHRMMTQQQHMGSMYSGSSSVSTTISGNSAGMGRGNAGMMMPPYYMNQSGVGPNDGQIHVRGRSPTNDMSAAEAGLVELEAIIGKLDKATSHNIKESLYRLARSAGARRGARGGGEGGGQHAQQPSDKAQSGVDRCVANLLYHRYPDAPAETPDAFQEGGQSQQMDGAGDGGNGRGVSGGVPAGMNAIRGRHGSA